MFFKVVFPTHNSCHVQFLIFYICSFDEVSFLFCFCFYFPCRLLKPFIIFQIFVSKFLEICWTKVGKWFLSHEVVCESPNRKHLVSGLAQELSDQLRHSNPSTYSRLVLLKQEVVYSKQIFIFF